MIPERFKDFLSTLYEKTANGEYKWNFDGKKADLITTTFSISIWYNFDHDRESGYLGVSYNYNNTPYTFFEYESERDYDFLRMIYDAVKISNLQFPF